MNEALKRTIEYLGGKQRVLIVTTSSRWAGEKDDLPKSTLLARRFAAEVGTDRVTILDVVALNIHPCEGNVSTSRGNSCGEKKALLKSDEKNPSGCHRCWASINNPDDELWLVSKALLESDAVVFLGSVRWGQMNSVYQKLIERLTWLESRHSTLGEDNVLAGIDAGIIAIGHNWNGAKVVETQKQVLKYFGFNVVDALCWNWQFTDDVSDESDGTYRAAATAFKETYLR